MKKLTHPLIIASLVLLSACQQQPALQTPTPPSSNQNSGTSSQMQSTASQASVNSVANSSNLASAQTPAPQPVVYNNQYMKITVPSDWTVTKVKTKPGAFNIIKGNYILYINPYATQASGVPGGRFSEISQGAPSADAVVLVPPSPPCGTAETNPGFQGHQRIDLYMNKTDKSEFCAAPTENVSVWYFSYITDSKGDYFNYYKDGIHSFVITIAYNSKNIDSFPQKGSAEIQSTLSDIDSILNTLVLKQQ